MSKKENKKESCSRQDEPHTFKATKWCLRWYDYEDPRETNVAGITCLLTYGN